MLLAIGPAILALALGTAHKKLLSVPKFITHPSGIQVQTWEPPGPDQTNSELIGEIRLGPRLFAAASLIVTILVHGAAAVSIGLAMSIGIKRSRKALAACVGLLVLIVIIMPIYLVMIINYPYNYIVSMWNFVMATDSLLHALFSRVDASIGDDPPIGTDLGRRHRPFHSWNLVASDPAVGTALSSACQSTNLLPRSTARKDHSTPNRYSSAIERTR